MVTDKRVKVGDSQRLQDHRDSRADLGERGTTVSLYISTSSLLETQLLDIFLAAALTTDGAVV